MRVELFFFEVTPDVHVARAGLAPEVVAAFRDSLLSLQAPQEKRLVERLHTITVKGFDPISDDDFNQLRVALTKAMACFESAA